jgi:hypothetical protein
MIPVPTQEGEDRLPPHRKPAQVEDEVHKIHTEMRKNILIGFSCRGSDGTQVNS